MCINYLCKYNVYKRIVGKIHEENITLECFAPVWQADGSALIAIMTLNIL